MTRLLLLILLLTVVYSWDECKYVLHAVWAKIRKRKITEYQKSETDLLVSDIVLIATIPLSLAFLMLGSQSLLIKLLLLLAEFVLIGLILRGLEEYRRRRKFTSHYQGFDKAVAIGFSVLGFLSPSMQFASGVVRSTTHVGKYLIALAIPLTLGLVLTFLSQQLGEEQFSSQLDVLIIIAVFGIILNITIEALEHMFYISKYKLSSLLRIVLGIFTCTYLYFML
ncbi:MAG: hypothetical protein A3I07_03860 [Candidatus Doudnabacteria bacterium RIFCSPLOWO2_02_FULL_42_9]|uniref:Uncharacterized protein n=1 Tax=Candidatus Doudnabacteria bacterium RIFCSPHIGHO2_01_FULL_41_86 TaxID=1817821 RepID=A0A1F5N795_9BACT|nr:MAG: hypothetical protein A2717_02975 [Candidatus Doudnabacteria bacterium RIFCSPHIGHO2_01_FULL_41_86]OGE74659.1 MAG: hypothetical protein A3K07_02570 [Candidatus Doudnabacteria bacterium RIFCSPHIGHO2_01_43_10]OGE85018.1 MAG: hypothetical protein A3E28_04380 [Candidatus Doudnabacteria bacterium RIFCSPHIGHO2_12_FULL_42_22]OGE86459.1 MAG: hypothetical protein A3C49_04560 [Candidatus Doudnabacteria bacterium RIFCSPHIGHO2_02_FULL_42_25]OGE91921.1 MAG: hypothetical protein A2895_01325 [Candidatus